MAQKKPRQRSIASFFAPAPARKKVSTPEKVVVARADSLLSEMASARSTFDDFASSDTSFGSPEVTNFKNPVLSRVSSNLTGSPPRKNHGISGSSQEKRQFSRTFFDLDARPKKVPRRVPKAASPSLSTSSVSLSVEQLAIIDAVVSRGENVFFTGSAGTGKSVVLREMVSRLYAKHGASHVGVTASTGLAACNIGGSTVHKFLHIGIGTGSPQEIAVKIKRNGSARKKWTSLAVLIIDEISMIDGILFEKIDKIAQILRNSTAPFGGIQLVCTGDFFQLPPVSKNQSARFCFLSDSWRKAIRNTFILTTVFRQKGDSELIEMLNSLRKGKLDDAMVAKFRQLGRKVVYDDNIEPTELYPTRQEVKAANQQRLRFLPGQSNIYKAQDSEKDQFKRKLYDNLMCEEILELKKGAQVMYLKNHPDNLVVNGSIGTVVGFITENLFKTLFDVLGEQTFCNMSEEYQQLLTLLCDLIGNRSMTSDQTRVFNNLPPDLHAKASRLIMEAYKQDPNEERMPLVSFLVDGYPTVLYVRREEFTVDQGQAKKDGQGNEMTRSQLPLLLAWAMSIHKAQGQSIDRLRVDLRKIFERGQVYVALSRATNKEHLEVINFDPRRITVAEEVLQFYSQISPVDVKREKSLAEVH
ncbi:hypothetical protein CLUG_03991 [Clavispora lusitaniae ATCC 42720]|uniref:AAA+ ATPase domain-containing protein n=1 Tax=Clavispora lusitaniae (strain ATCC 42720) TaxID=306902 RepID=C4Y757_CLAL4|nr:uncharacterized protein CLUG_03991 [Clavispora lusitaniae ATCC 42720]EEQ39863.1 hypothetical protein CLUG_03991 [Clavispora lusitaniae ATCC 42720]